jgi:hypothetical protein
VDLTLRKTLIGGDTLHDDYYVIHDGRSIGRIHKTHGLNGSTVWSWHVNPPLPIPSWCNGSADSLELAKDQFKAAWERFYASLTTERIRRWHLIEDLGTSNSWWLE